MTHPKLPIIIFRGKAKWIFREHEDSGGSEGCVVVVNNAPVSIHEVGDVFVAVVEVVGNFA